MNVVAILTIIIQFYSAFARGLHKTPAWKLQVSTVSEASQARSEYVTTQSQALEYFCRSRLPVMCPLSSSQLPLYKSQQITTSSGNQTHKSQSYNTTNMPVHPKEEEAAGSEF